MSRGRKPIDVSPKEFQDEVSKLELCNSFTNRSELWKALEETFFAKSTRPRPLLRATAHQLAKKFQTVIKTPVGKRGREKGSKVPEGFGGGHRKARTINLEVLNALSSVTPPEQRSVIGKLLEKAAKGNAKACIKLKCLDCTNWQKLEIKNCDIKECSLHNIRPYK